MKYFMLMVLLSFGAFAQDDNFYNFADHTLVSPAEGMWYDKDEPGRGVTVEIQDGRILATYFGYKQNGDAIWWQGVGYRDDNNQNKYAGSFSTGKNGQCVGCAYTAPEFDEANSIGDFTMTFVNGNEADFTWAGKNMTLVKYYYGYEKPIDRAKGLWVLRRVNDFSSSFTKDFLLWEDRTVIGAGNARYKVVTGLEIRTFNVAAAVQVYDHGIGDWVVIFAYAQPPGEYSHSEAYVVKLDHVSGKSSFNSTFAPGFISSLDAETYHENIPVEAVRIADLDAAQPYIEYNSQFLSELKSLSVSEKSAITPTKTINFIDQNVVDGLVLLKGVIEDIYSEL